MTDDSSISVWIGQLKGGDAEAARKLWARYYHRLVGLARKKLQSASRASTDEDDVVQSAFKSFCLRAQAGLFPDLSDRDNLWPLLVLITSRKAANQRKHQLRAKRGGGQSQISLTPDGSDDAAEFALAISEEPTPSDAAIFNAELDRCMESLHDPAQRLILLWKLEDRTNEEIARHLDCSLSAVERKLRLIRRLLSQSLQQGEAT